MAADIKNYLKEKEKRQKSQDDYKKKIRKHRLKIVYRVLLVVAALGAALALVVVQAKRHIYTGYDTVSSTSREVSSDATDIRLKNSILTYSKDGAHCTDAKGNVKWNQLLVAMWQLSAVITAVRSTCRIRTSNWELLQRPCRSEISQCRKREE